MKKSILLFFVFCFSIFIISAQNPLPKGGSQLNAGFGFSRWGLPIYVGFDYGFHPDVTIGGEVSFRSYNYKFSNDLKHEDYRFSIWGLSGNANYHFTNVLQIPKEIDVYAGLNVGFYIWTSSSKHEGFEPYSGLGLGLQIGGRYFFTKQLAVNLEVGGGYRTNGGKIGITYKF